MAPGIKRSLIWVGYIGFGVEERNNQYQVENQLVSI
jgi:hypothetical protein